MANKFLLRALVAREIMRRRFIRLSSAQSAVCIMYLIFVWIWTIPKSNTSVYISCMYQLIEHVYILSGDACRIVCTKVATEQIVWGKMKSITRMKCEMKWKWSTENWNQIEKENSIFNLKWSCQLFGDEHQSSDPRLRIQSSDPGFVWIG